MAFFEKLGFGKKEEKAPSTKKMRVESHADAEASERAEKIFTSTVKEGNFYAQVRLNHNETLFGQTQQNVGYKETNPTNPSVNHFFGLQGEKTAGRKIIGIHEIIDRKNSSKPNQPDPKSTLQVIHVTNADGQGCSLFSIKYLNSKRDDSKRLGNANFILAVSPEDAVYLSEAFQGDPNGTLDLFLTTIDPNAPQVASHFEFSTTEAIRIDVEEGKDITKVDSNTIRPKSVT